MMARMNWKAEAGVLAVCMVAVAIWGYFYQPEQAAVADHQIPGVSERITNSMGKDLEDFHIVSMEATLVTAEYDHSYSGKERYMKLLTIVDINGESVELSGEFSVDRSYFKAPNLKKVPIDHQGLIQISRDGDAWKYLSSIEVMDPIGPYQNHIAHYNVAREISQFAIRMAKLETDAYVSWEKALQGPDEGWMEFVSSWQHEKSEVEQFAQVQADEVSASTGQDNEIDN